MIEFSLHFGRIFPSKQKTTTTTIINIRVKNEIIIK